MQMALQRSSHTALHCSGQAETGLTQNKFVIVIKCQLTTQQYEVFAREDIGYGHLHATANNIDEAAPDSSTAS
ncbi:hypothetical protein C0W65_19705 [Bacillus subtilis]|nr:hypothetical protein C0W65_19705 [Bacillus subtilis]